jgi:S1-C subfamily serine protease
MVGLAPAEHLDQSQANLPGDPLHFPYSHALRSAHVSRLLPVKPTRDDPCLGEEIYHRDAIIIKAHGGNFRTLTLGNSDQLQVGEEVIAIGNPLSLESTVSNGIISGIRTVEEEGGKFLQVTTPISPGGSGGPLFNMAGEVVGITTVYIKSGENLNFAIPINDAKRLLLANSSKVQALPNETEPVKAPPAQQVNPQQQNAATNAQKVDCAQYEQTKGCLVFNEMIRAKDKGLLET